MFTVKNSWDIGKGKDEKKCDKPVNLISYKKIEHDSEKENSCTNDVKNLKRKVNLKAKICQPKKGKYEVNDKSCCSSKCADTIEMLEKHLNDNKGNNTEKEVETNNNSEEKGHKDNSEKNGNDKEEHQNKNPAQDEDGEIGEKGDMEKTTLAVTDDKETTFSNLNDNKQSNSEKEVETNKDREETDLKDNPEQNEDDEKEHQDVSCNSDDEQENISSDDDLEKSLDDTKL